MSHLSASKKLGILWSHNKLKYPGWMDDLRARAMAIKSQGFVWWDVGWRINFEQFSFPITGYIWNTVDERATHTTLIEQGSRTLHQPEKRLAEEVNENLERLKIHVNDNSPLVEYLRGERQILTLLKFTDLKELSTPLRLADFRLKDGTPVLQPPEGYYRIQLP